MPGFDPGIHGTARFRLDYDARCRGMVDRRVKPGDDEGFGFDLILSLSKNEVASGATTCAVLMVRQAHHEGLWGGI